MRRMTAIALAGALVAAGGIVVLGGPAPFAGAGETRLVDVAIVDERHGTPEVTSRTAVPEPEARRLQREAPAGVTVSLDTMLTLAGGAAAASDPLRASQWHLDAVHATALAGIDTTTTTVAVLDTGVVAVDGMTVAASTSFVDASATPFEHGTGVAAAIAAASGGGGGLGIVPGTRLLSARVCIAALCPTSAVARGIVWAADQGADVINLSLGGGYSAVLDRAVAYARSRGAVVVAAAGNASCATPSPTCDPDADNVAYPAALPGVVSVTSVGASRRPSVWTSKGRHVTIAAPGEDIWTSGPGLYGSVQSGTSWSAPLVSGVLAALHATEPGLSGDELVAALRLGSTVPADTVLPRPGLPRGWYYGAGVLDAAGALVAARAIGSLAGGAAPLVASRAGTLDVSWPAVPGALGYAVRVDGNPALASGLSTATSVGGLLDGQTYGVAIDANLATGTVTTRAVLATPASTLAAPVVVSTVDAADGSGDVLVSLAAPAPGADAVEATLDGRPLGRVALPAGPTPIVRVPIGAAVTNASLQLVYVAVTGGRSVPVTRTVSTSRFLPAPGNVGVDVGDRRITLRWDAVAGATTYDVDFAFFDRTSSPGRWVTRSFSTAATSAQLTGVVNGATYHLSVNSRVVLTGATSASVDVAAVALAPPLDPPAAIDASTVGGLGGDTLRLRFAAVAGADRYVVTSTSAAPREVAPTSIDGGVVELQLADSAFRFGRTAAARVCVASVRVLDSGTVLQYGAWSNGVSVRLGDVDRHADGDSCTDLRSLDALPLGPGFTARRPVRLADTRTSAPVAAGGVLAVDVAGTAGLGTDVAAVAANVTAVDGAAPGYLTVWPCGTPRPLASSVNYARGDVSSNSVFAALGDGRLCVFASAAVHVVVDVTGTFAGRAPSFTTVAPHRLVDTRDGDLGGRLAAGSTVAVPVAGRAGVPIGATAATVNLTGIDAARAGFVTVWPCDTDRPATSNLNLTAGGTRPNLVTAGLSASGELCIYSQSELDLAVDLAGWWAGAGTGAAGAGAAGTGAAGAAAFVPVTPSRLVDTRTGQGVATRLAAGQSVEVAVAGVVSVPADVRRVSLNVTVVGPEAAGFVALWPCSERPLVSNLNFVAGQTIPNAVAIALAAGGTMCLYSNAATDVVVDVTGYWT